VVTSSLFCNAGNKQLPPSDADRDVQSKALLIEFLHPAAQLADEAIEFCQSDAYIRLCESDTRNRTGPSVGFPASYLLATYSDKFFPTSAQSVIGTDT
jgi:hypothetical protein